MAELRVGRRAVHNFWRQLEEFSTQFRHLRALVALAGWDQETYMPPGAAQRRAAQLATAQKLLHRHMNSTVARRLALRAHQILPLLPERKQRIVSCFLREYRRYTALPEQLLEELSYAQTLALESWKLARRESDFSLFAPYLQRLLELKRQQIEFLGYEEHPYDALLGLYEPGLRLSRLQPMLQELTVAVRQLLQWVQSRPVQPSDRLLHQSIPADEQLSLARIVCRQIGFDEGRGRLDLSAHPFCTALGPSDVRMTTRIHSGDASVCFYSVLHELGHALYEQGIPEELADSFAGEAVSMAIHESQSLLWEDIIGRSLAFCQWLFPLWQERFGRYVGEQWEGASAEELFGAVNRVQPSLIRTEADEVTYHLHIQLRLELELALLAGELRVWDLPDAWNDGMERLLGIRPREDRSGCLQDIHWALGDFGYFPTYSLGKLVAAILWKQMQRELPGLEQHICAGEFQPVLQWLRRTVHESAPLENGEELVQRIAGAELTVDAFVEYITDKLRRVYGEPLQSR